MGIRNIIRNFLGKKESDSKAPFVIISKDPEVIEYENIETAISELEKDPDIPSYKIEKIRTSLEELKNKGKIRIKNGEIIR